MAAVTLNPFNMAAAASCNFEEFIKSQEAKSTQNSNKSAANRLRDFAASIGEERDLHHIPANELDGLLGRFFIEVRKVKDRAEYEPDVLSTMHRAIKRHLDDVHYPHDILKDPLFETSRKVLAAKRKQLRKLGLGNCPNAMRELSEEEVNLLFDQNYFGFSSGETVQRTVWWFLSLHFGWRGRDEARKVCWGDVVLKGGAGGEYLEWDTERGTKTRDGRECEERRRYNPTAYPSESDRCPIKAYKLFAAHRPQEALHPNSPFFLTIDLSKSATDNIWYKPKPMGKNSLGKILALAREKCGLQGKVANHSVRKTGISTLLDYGVPELYVAQHSGMKSTESLKSYKRASLTQQRTMSDVLNGAVAGAQVVPINNSAVRHLQPRGAISDFSKEPASPTALLISARAVGPELLSPLRPKQNVVG